LSEGSRPRAPASPAPNDGCNVFAACGGGEDLLRYLNELQKCVRCGQCRASCPVFRESGLEADVARGKLALVLHYLTPGEVPDRELYGRLTQCVNCGRCRLECPSGTDTGYALIEARARLLKSVGMPAVKALAVRGLFGHQGLLNAAASCLRLVQPLIFRPTGTDPRHVRSLWRLPPFGQKVLLPRLRRTSRAVPDVRGTPGGPALGEEEGTLVVYPGCLIDLGYPDLLDDLRTVFARLRWRVVVPEGLVCCGAPAAYAGDVETARRLAAVNLRAVLPHVKGAGSETTRLGFLCPSCAVAFKQDYPDYLFGKLSGSAMALSRSGGLEREDLDLVSSRVEDATALAWRLGIAEYLRPGAVSTVTYHDPCHLRRLLDVVDEPRAALRALAHDGYREAPAPDSCCGFGGTFALEHHQASAGMLAARSRDLASTGADVVATACPGCMAWLANGLDRIGSGQSTVHLIELLARGLC